MVYFSKGKNSKQIYLYFIIKTSIIGQFLQMLWILFLTVFTSEICKILFSLEKVKSYIPKVNKFLHLVYFYVASQP